MKNRLPKFKSEEQERKFWASHDSADYLDWRRGQRVVLPNLRPRPNLDPRALPKTGLARRRRVQ